MVLIGRLEYFRILHRFREDIHFKQQKKSAVSLTYGEVKEIALVDKLSHLYFLCRNFMPSCARDNDKATMF